MFQVCAVLTPGVVCCDNAWGRLVPLNEISLDLAGEGTRGEERVLSSPRNISPIYQPKKGEKLCAQ